jgi:hypothetical protein
MLPANYGGCRPGWYHWIWHEPSGSPPDFFCGRPPPEDDWGYFPHSLSLVRVAVAAAGAFLARALAMTIRGRRSLAGAEAAVGLILVGGALAVSFQPPVEERTGQVAATLRCLDAGCAGMTVEQAIMSEPPGRRIRYPLAGEAWDVVWNGLYDGGMSPDAIRASLARKYGPDILLD